MPVEGKCVLKTHLLKRHIILYKLLCSLSAKVTVALTLLISNEMSGEDLDHCFLTSFIKLQKLCNSEIAVGSVATVSGR